MRKEPIIAGSTRFSLMGAATIAMIAPGPAWSARAQQEFHIAAGPLDQALATYARITHRQLLYPSTLVAGRTSQALDGRYGDDEALAQLLRGTGIAVRRAGNAYVLFQRRVPAPRTAAKPARPQRATPMPATPISAPAPRAAQEESGDTKILVTGSNIRGISERASPMVVLDRFDIDRAGHGSVGEAIAALPQNFGGTGTEDTSLTGADRTTQNIGLGTSANLRGLGSDATLTLVNGRRLPGSGGQGDFADISLIPLAAVERIEILTDGASALYGSDAVGGVVNILLRKTLDGGETRLRLGTATQGGASEVQIGQVLGASWSTGHVLAAYEYMHRGRLRTDQRAYTRSPDLRPFGGSDWRSYFSNPGTILTITPAGAIEPAFAIPTGQNGTGLSPKDFAAGQNLENFRVGTDLLPRQDRHAAYLSAEQDLGTLQLFAEGRYAHRSFESNGQASTGLAQVDARNPYFVSPDGSPYSLIAYSFTREIGPIRQPGSVTSWSATAGATVAPFGDWQAETYVSHARERTYTAYENVVNSTYFAEAVGSLPDDPGTAFSTATNGFFNPYGDGLVNSQAILDFIGQGFARNTTISVMDTANLKADGSLFRLPGGRIKAAFGVNFRHEHFERSGENFFSGTKPTALTGTHAGRDITAAFAELAVPLFGPDNGRPGLRRLTLSAAVRHEHYSDFGGTTNPKLGLVWEPSTELGFKASWGTSFRAPVLREVRDALSVSYVQLRDAAGVLTPVVTLYGGNPDLKPETASSLTLNLRYQPNWARRWHVEATWFQTKFKNRIERPAYDNLSDALSNMIFSPYISRVDPVANPADRERLLALINAPGSLIAGLFPPEFYKAILDGRLVNSSELVVRGMDLLAAGSFDLAGGAATLSANASHMFDYQRRITPLAPRIDQVGTIANPPAWRLRASAGWDRQGWGVSVTLNHVSGYLDDVSSPARPVGSWTTFDAQLRIQPKAFERIGLSFALNAQNLLDADPPFVDQPSGFGYGAANADPIGRFVSLQVVKKW
ncbi:outer membrane receptor protein involved in Fe transport [Sphingomonas kyeonggiensis]|uniref:Outer membrane receptor protein involved in Fe transport n=1 Tax=Sphingomonas kyeonggiensis TaxID=1268553 RepID=A0A7W7K6K3_9SPHN|nr:TonB-dependent receptor [Sphingomonas kyeonggiensis]MBB4841476.1 outer membrane receptor protein involved in Fe transport [Sphingomonas kyeonggiensis]